VRRLILLVALLLVVNTASAEEMGIGTNPGGLWLGESLEVTCWFGQEPGETAGVWAEITEPISLQLTGFSRKNETYFSRTYGPPVIGQYVIRCVNGSLESDEAGFSVSELDVEIVECPEQAFTDEGVRIGARVTKNGGDSVQLTSGVDFSVTLDGVGLGIVELPYYYVDHWVIETEGLEGFGPGNYNIRLFAEYKEREASDQKWLDVMKPLEFCIESVSPGELHGGENVTVTLAASYHNSSVLSASTVSARLDGEGLAIGMSPSGFRFVCPALEPEPHTLDVSIEYYGHQASDSWPIYYMIPVSGEVRNAEGGGVSATLNFVRDGWQKSVRTNVNGAFTVNVPAGRYTLEMSFPASIYAMVEGLDIYKELRDFVRFDTFTSGEIDGIRVAKAFALEFSPAYDRMAVRAEYDGSAISDESKLMVYTCDDWNLDSRSCSGSWDELDFDIDSMKNEVEFEPEHLSGFLIGRRGELRMEASINREEYVTGQNIELSGVVKDENSRTVPDVRITYTIAGGAEGHVNANSNGVFSASIPVPSDGGEHTLRVRASKGLYVQDSQSLEFTSLTFKDLTIIPPIRADASEGSEVPVDFVIINTGQEGLKNFRISLSGIPEGWYQAEPEEWDSLLPDEERGITLKIRPESPDKEIYTVGIDVACDQLSKSESFVMYVKPLQEEKEEEAMETNASRTESSPFDSITLYLAGSHEAIINTASLLASAGMLFLIVRRVKAGRGPRNRAWLMTLLEAVKSEVIRSPERFQRSGRAVRRGLKRPGAVRRKSERHIEVEV
jgi:hypothetical protein